MKAFWPWLLLYVFSNIIAASIIWNTSELIGDLSGVALHSQSALLFATLLIVLSYTIILWPVFNFIEKIKIKNIHFGFYDNLTGERIGKLLFILQVFFIIFNLSTGVNIAGSNNTRTDSSFAMFWVLVPVDALFFVYYGMYRENKYFYPNVMIYLISNVLRGWSSVFMFVIFFEWCRAIRNNRITINKTIMTGVAILIFYPVLLKLKFLFRTSVGADISIFALATGFIDIFNDVNYFLLIGDGVMHLIGRFQVTSMVVEVIRMSDLIQVEFTNGKFTPFWLEGLHGIIFNRLFTAEKYIPIGVAFTQYGDFGAQFDVGDWNTNIGYVGWFFIAPYLIPLYIFYTFLLGFFSFYLVKKIGISESSKDMLWLAWLVYLMPPWFAAFTGFIYTLFLFLVIKLILSRLPPFRWIPRVIY